MNLFKSVTPLTHEVFNQWRQGDVEARDKAMVWFFSKFWNLALHNLGDEDDANDVLQDTFFQLDELVKNGRVEWKEAEKFESYVRQRLLWRITDEQRRGLARSFLSLFEPVDSEDEELERIDVLPPPAEPSSEQIALQREATTIIIKGLLFPLREHLKAINQSALAEVVGAMIEYVIKCLWEALPPNCPEPQTLDELLERFDTKAVDFRKDECYEFIMNNLGISRNVLDQRLKRLRPIMREWLERIIPELLEKVRSDESAG